MKAAPKSGLDRSKTGRAKGTPNKTTALLKDAILKAAELAGGPNGIAGYLQAQADKNPGPFMALLGKVLPMTVSGDPENPVNHKHVVEVQFITAPTESGEK